MKPYHPLTVYIALVNNGNVFQVHIKYTASCTQHVHIHIHHSYTNKEFFHPETMSSNKGSSSSKVLPSKDILPFGCMQNKYNKYPQTAKQSCLLSESVGHAHPKVSPRTRCSYTAHTRTIPSFLHRDVQLTASSSKSCLPWTLSSSRRPNLQQTPAILRSPALQ